jgi:hypothetical protein
LRPCCSTLPPIIPACMPVPGGAMPVPGGPIMPAVPGGIMLRIAEPGGIMPAVPGGIMPRIAVPGGCSAGATAIATRRACLSGLATSRVWLSKERESGW